MACTPSDLLAPTACCDKYTEHDLLRLIVGALCQTLQAIDPMADCNPTDWLVATGRMNNSSRHDLLRMILGVLCEILQAGGLGGQSCISCGVVDPVADPNCTCAFYYRTDNGAEWIWDDGAGVWRQILGGP